MTPTLSILRQVPEKFQAAPKAERDRQSWSGDGKGGGDWCGDGGGGGGNLFWCLVGCVLHQKSMIKERPNL